MRRRWQVPAQHVDSAEEGGVDAEEVDQRLVEPEGEEGKTIEDF